MPLENNKIIPKCWICNENDANSGEHSTKASDINFILGAPTQGKPFYYNSSEKRNVPLRSVDSKFLKPVKICHDCNTSRTQPYDLAWDRVLEYLHIGQGKLKVDNRIRRSGIFPYNSKSYMLDLHLFFVKCLGCCFEEADKFDLVDKNLFSECLCQRKPHPNIYLAFGPKPPNWEIDLGRSDLHLEIWNDKCSVATYLVWAGNFWVQVIYAAEGEKRIAMEDSFHPTKGKRNIFLKDFSSMRA